MPLPSSDELARLLRFRDAGHGFDEFGFHPPTLGKSLKVVRHLYERYFRVQSHGAHHIPREGGGVIAANHSGTLPLDGVMLVLDVLANTDPRRLARPVFDLFVPRLPFVGTFFARCGGVSGTRGNFRRLLEAGELVSVFPEGVPGVAKTFWHRYQLQGWRVGHVELAIRHRVPVIPAAIIGAEEQWPLLARFDSFKLFGAPYLPIPATPFPLPVRYRIHYGEPIPFHEEHPPEASDDPAIVAAGAARVKAAVAALISNGLREREGIF